MSLLFCFPNCGHMNRVTVHQECILLPLIQHLQDPFPGRVSQWLLVHVNHICRYTLIKPSLPLEGTLFSGPGHTGTWLIWFDVEATRVDHGEDNIILRGIYLRWILYIFVDNAEGAGRAIKMKRRDLALLAQ